MHDFTRRVPHAKRFDLGDAVLLIVVAALFGAIIVNMLPHAIDVEMDIWKAKVPANVSPE